MDYKFLYLKFKEIDINDDFFTSLKNDYKEFEDWFNRKSEDFAYVQKINDKIEGFLYLKKETGPIDDIDPIIDCDVAIKIGTMKINPHGTRLGERFIKKALDFAIQNNTKTIYVTVFEKHNHLINLYEKYGFKKHGIKNTVNGSEFVLIKNLDQIDYDSKLNYPKINTESDAYLLAIEPQYHTRMFPDSRLNTEDIDIVKDVSHTNSIEKIYICRMNGVSNLKEGDLLLIYRKTDIQGRARYRSVATSICVVDEVVSTRNFATFADYKNYCKNYSIFTDDELNYLYNSRYEYLTIKMTYNIALPKRIIRNDLIETIGLSESNYWGFFKIPNDKFNSILNFCNVNPNYFI